MLVASLITLLVVSVIKPFVHQPTLDWQIPSSLDALAAGRERSVGEAEYDSKFSNSACAPGMCASPNPMYFRPPGQYSNKEFSTLKKQLLWECQRSLCNPLCLHTAWGTEFKVKSCSDSGNGPDGEPSKFCKLLKQQVGLRSTQIALSAQIQAHACDSILSCCKNPMNTQSADKLHWLPRWVEERSCSLKSSTYILACALLKLCCFVVWIRIRVPMRRMRNKSRCGDTISPLNHS